MLVDLNGTYVEAASILVVEQRQGTDKIGILCTEGRWVEVKINIAEAVNIINDGKRGSHPMTFTKGSLF